MGDGSNKEKTVRLKFTAPPQVGTYTFSVLVKSDSFVGADLEKQITVS